MGNVTNKVPITLGQILHRLMEVKKITNAELSRKSGLSKNHICALRNDKINFVRGMRPQTFNALADNLDVPSALLYNAPYYYDEESGEIIK